MATNKNYLVQIKNKMKVKIFPGFLYTLTGKEQCPPSPDDYMQVLLLWSWPHMILLQVKKYVYIKFRCQKITFVFDYF